jgi:hypothetical protein
MFENITFLARIVGLNCSYGSDQELVVKTPDPDSAKRKRIKAKKGLSSEI